MIDFDEVHGGSLAGWGESFRRSQLHRFARYVRLLDGLPADSRGRVLELGCSTGYFSGHYLFPRYGARLRASDLSPVAVDIAKSGFSQIDFELCALPETGHESGAYALVTALELLYYLDGEGQKAGIDELHRLLQVGGHVLLSVNIGAKPYFDRQEIIDLVERRFRVVRCEGIYIRSYYEKVEQRLWQALEWVADPGRLTRKQDDSRFKGVAKGVVNVLFKHRLASRSYGRLVALVIKALLYCMPVGLIDAWGRLFRPGDELSLLIILARKENRAG